MARVVQFTQPGPPDVLEVVEVPRPEPGAGQVLVEMAAVGVNPLDTKIRSGVRPLPPGGGPYRPGFDGAGVVRALGQGVTGFAEGDRVVVERTPGTYASHVVADAPALTVMPEGVRFEQAAALGIPVATAHQSLVSLDVRPGSTLVVHGGSGAVGQAVLQLATAQDVTVVATAGEANHDRIRELGGHPVVYGDGLLERLREATPQGVDRVLDIAGTDEALGASLALVDDPQHVATLVMGARADELGIQAYLGGSPEPLTDEQQRLRAEAVPTVLPLIADGRFVVEVARELSLDDAAEAHRLVEAGGLRGKIVLRP